MKWLNKGHEFDELFNNIMKIKRFYLYGAGDYGRNFFSIFKKQIDIVSFLDNEKCGQTIEGVQCLSPQSVEIKKDEAIIITIAQWARVKVIHELVDRGLVRDRSFFIIEEFMTVYNLYANDKVFIPSISFLPSTRCNLNCKHCLNFNPYAKEFYSRSWEELVDDIEIFFNCVDEVMIFHISGGEPLLYKNTGKLIKYINDNYGDRIHVLRTVTNGTIIPSDDLLSILSETKIEIFVDDYRDAVPQYAENFEELIGRLQRHNIKYVVNKVDNWIDLAPDKTDFSNLTESEIIAHRNSCEQSWQELRGGKLYSCNYAAYAAVAGLVENQNKEETFDLSNFNQRLSENSNLKKELIEFRLGYTEKGYTNFCKRCRGFTKENIYVVEPAIQLSR